MTDDYLNDAQKPPRPRASRPQRPLVLNGLPTRILTPEEEQDLIKDGSEDAKQSLILHNMRAACGYAQKVCKGNIDGEDIFSACYDALRRAVENFKAGQQTFLGYAKPYIRGAIFKVWKAQKVVPRSFIIQLAGDDSDDDLLSELSVSFDYYSIYRCEQIENIKAFVDKALSEQERVAIELHNIGEMTFKEIGEALGCSRSNVQQIYDRAIKKLRSHFAPEIRTT